VALFVDPVSSGVVLNANADAHGWSFVLLSSGGGPDCVLLFIMHVFLVKARNLFVISDFSIVPYVICTHRFEYNGIQVLPSLFLLKKGNLG
jgi:hypothetical protein